MVFRLFEAVPILLKGGGDLASGVAYRLSKAGFPIIITELAHPLTIRRTVSYGSAVYEGHITIEGLTARHIDVQDIFSVLAAGEIPVLVDEDGNRAQHLNLPVLIDARMAKQNLGISINDARLVVALGPGHTAGKDCHAVIETNRGHFLGRVIWQGSAEPNTGQPGAVKGHVADRVLRAPAEGYIKPEVEIGDRLRAGQLIGTVAGQAIIAPFDSLLRGLIHPSVPVSAGMKIGDVDPRAERDFCYKISDKSLAIGGAVVEAVLSSPQLFTLLHTPR